MRILLIGILSALLIGCSCPSYTHTTLKACTSKGCLHRTAAVTPIEVKPATFKPSPAAATGKLSSVATNATSSSPRDSSRENKTSSSTLSPESPASPQSAEDEKTIIATKMDDSGQPSEISDPVLQKAKTTVAAKMEAPASAKFEDMKRAMRSDTFGQSIDTICGHVKGKTASGETTEKRPFLYVVKDDVAFVDYGNPGSVAANAYRAICTSPDPYKQDIHQ